MTSFTIPGFDLAHFVSATLDEDLGVGLPGGGRDVTSESVIPADARFAGVMDSRDAIIVAGLPIAEAFFRKLDPSVKIELLVAEGERVAPGTALLRLEGNGRALLTAERSALNTIQHLSGMLMPWRVPAPFCWIPARPFRAFVIWKNTPRAWVGRKITAWGCGMRR